MNANTFKFILAAGLCGYGGKHLGAYFVATNYGIQQGSDLFVGTALALAGAWVFSRVKA